MESVDKARKELLEALGDKATKYWELLKLWYKRKISKDDFDLKAKSILGEEGVQLHNEFLFAILVKCQSSSSSELSVGELRPDRDLVASTKSANESGKAQKRARLDGSAGLATDLTPYGVLDDFSYVIPTIATVVCGSKDLDQLLLCSHELLLPDLPTLHMRMLLIAWEAGLEGVSEESAQYMLTAIEYFMKNVIQACISSQEKRYHVRQPLSDGTMQQQNISSKLFEAEAMEAEYKSTQTSLETSSYHIITPFHIRDIIHYTKGLCIPNYFVCHGLAERTLATMWHPSKKELASKHTVEQWKKQL